MNRKLILPVILLFILINFYSSALSAALTDKTLTNDINYYKRISAEKELGSNDRYFILLRIEEKYKNANINLKPLLTEMKKLESPETAEATAVTKPKETSKPNQTATEPALGYVTKVIVSETSRVSKVSISANNISNNNFFLLKDPDPLIPPQIVLDLYGAELKLSDAAKDISLKNGLFSRIVSEQFQTEPAMIVRISAYLRTERPYRVYNEGNTWFITADKEEPKEEVAINTDTEIQPETDLAAVEPVVVAPKPLPVKSPKAVNKTNSTNISSKYSLDIGDVIQVSIQPAEELSREVVVQPDSYINFPLIGSVVAKGLTPDSLEEVLRSKLSNFIANPKVSITLKKFSRRQVFITGEVKTVGAQDYKENTRLLEFISSLGGFTENANRTKVKVYRGPVNSRQTYLVDLEEIIKTGDFTKDFLLEPGDIIEVPKGSAKVSILGEVREPGFIDYTENMHLAQVISVARGYTDSANTSNITIVRQEVGKEKIILKANLNKILSGKVADIPVQIGDSIFVAKKGVSKFNWVLSNIMPWLSLAALIITLRGGI